MGGSPGTDYLASFPNGLILSATGTFAHVSSGIKEAGQFQGAGGQVANAYTLQMNTQFFPTSACAGTGNPNGDSGNANGCFGWQQFVYSSHDNELFMQYWLIDYDATCPTGYTTFQFPNSSSIYCYESTPSVAYPGGGLNAADLASVSLQAIATPDATDAGGNVGDFLSLELGSGQIVGVNRPDTVLNAASQWNTTQWGVYGDEGGGQANFGSGDSLEPETTFLSSSQAAPTCVGGDTTGETNNLSLTATPAISSSGLLFPTIGSKQKRGATGSPSCASIGPSPAPGIQYNVAFVAKSTQNLYQDHTSDPLAWPASHTGMDGHSAQQAPAITKFGNEYVMAYVGVSNNDILISTSKDGAHWSAAATVSGQTTDLSPALADYDGTLVMAYISSNGSNDVIVTTTTTPTNWANNGAVIPQQSPSTPALAVYGNTLVMALRFNNGSNDIGITTTTTPNSWGTTGYLLKGQQTGLSPALVDYDGTLVMAYISNNGSKDVLVTTTTSPSSWANNAKNISQESPSTPSLLVYEGNLALALRFNNGSDDIGVTETTTPSEWGTVATKVPGQATRTTPVLY